MYLTQQIQIKKEHEFFAECDRVCFLSKNLYNQALYRIKKKWEESNEFLSYYTLYKILADENQVDYRALPQNVSAATLIEINTAYKNYFSMLKSYKQNPMKFKGLPQSPYFKHKINGRFKAVYTKVVIRSKALRKEGIISLTGTEIRIPTKHKEIREVHIIPNKNKVVDCYTIEIIYKKEEEKPIVSDNYAGLDLGLNNLATICSNNTKIKPIIINGKPLKSINQFYNKKLSSEQSKLTLKTKGKQKSSKKIRKLTKKRNNKIKNYLHKASRKVVDYLKHNNISNLVLGLNPDWKQEINIGDKNNQNFVLIPHKKFLDMLIYKCQLVGISTQVREESYTSKCSFADNETIRKHNEYKGKRIKRGLFQASNGFKYNADLNGALNILKKEFPKAFDHIEGNGIEDLMISPTCLQVN